MKTATHYPERVRCLTSATPYVRNLQPGFATETVCYGVAPLDATDALPRGGSYLRTHVIDGRTVTWETGYTLRAGWGAA